MDLKPDINAIEADKMFSDVEKLLLPNGNNIYIHKSLCLTSHN